MGLYELAIALAAGLVLGAAIVILIHKMIDGVLPFLPGCAAVIVTLMLLMLTIHPPHPAMPMVVGVVAISLMGFAPYAAEQLEAAELRGLDTAQLEKAFQTFIHRPDNVVALLQIAAGLHAHGFRAHAIAIARTAINGLSGHIDPVQNRSARDFYRKEEWELKRWENLAKTSPPKDGPLACASCKQVNPVGVVACTQCGRAYLLDHARRVNLQPLVWGKLVVAWSTVALTIVAASYIGLRYQGWAMAVALVAAILVAGLTIALLFRGLRAPDLVGR